MFSNMNRSKFPILIGGKKPAYTKKGKQVPYNFKTTFDPDSDDLTPFLEHDIKPLMQLPKNSLGTIINTPEGRLFLLCPNCFRGSIEGEVKYKDCCFEIPKTSGLVIFRQAPNGEMEHIL